MSGLYERSIHVFGSDAPLFYAEPVELVRGDGVWLYDSNGARYLDVYNNVPSVGHANPRVAAAMHEQATTLNVHSRYLHANVIEYAERLAGLHHDALESIVFTCTGSEANEVAIMMARTATSKRGIICTDATYHGNTSEVAKLTRLPIGLDRDGVRSVSTPQLFRPLQEGLSEPELCERHLDELRRVIAGFEDEGVGFAGILLCSILANEGLTNAPANYFSQMVDIVHEAGGLVIADEVQAGFARSGSWWGYETNSFVPDIAVMGKPMGNGMPIAGVISSNELVTQFRRTHRYFNTFAASPLQAAVGTAVVDEIVDRGLVDQVDAVGASMRDALRALQPSHPEMGDVRGCGSFIGIDWVEPGSTTPDADWAGRVVEAMKERHVLMGKAGQHRNVLKIRPPLVFDHEHADVFMAAFEDALSAAR